MDIHQFEATVLAHGEKLRARAMRLTRNGPDADDLLQETLEKAFGAWHRFDGANAPAWLYQIMRNSFLNAIAARRRAADRDRRLAYEPTAGITQPERLSDGVVRALRALPDAWREVVMLVDLAGLTHAEAGRRLGVPLGTVLSRVHRGRARLRELLQAEAADYGIGGAS